MKRDILYDHDTFFTAKHSTGEVAIMRQPAGCLTAHLVTTLPLNEAIRACNALRREVRSMGQLVDVVLPL